MRKLIDFLELTVVPGDGAKGAVSFRREKYIPRGGPDGGDGGRGGDIIFQAKKNLSSLSHLHGLRIIKAKNGEPGIKKRKHGKDGEPALIQVPLGTLLKDTAGTVIKDFDVDEEQFVMLKGGLGGKGNSHFATSINQAPRYSQKGIPGLPVNIQLEIKLIADLGLVGLPNAGKSTFITAITRAKSKIAPYPFTTLTPVLGVLELNSENNLIIADIPGIIEGAHEGSGLGLDFLRHIERTFYLFIIVDVNEENPYNDFLKLRNELKHYSQALFDKPFTIGISKIDSCDLDRIKEVLKMFPKDVKNKIIPFSSIAKMGMEEIKEMCFEIIKKRNEQKKVEIV